MNWVRHGFQDSHPSLSPCTMSWAHCRSTPPKRGGWGRQRPDPKEGKQGASRMRPDPPLQVGLRATMGRAHDLRRGRTEIDTFPVRPPSSGQCFLLQNDPESGAVEGNSSSRQLLRLRLVHHLHRGPIDPSSPDWSYFTDQVWGKFIASADDDSSLLLLASPR